eukprot:SAG22_NODE_821_length_7008_cov_8.279635_5_plen_121_part_00
MQPQPPQPQPPQQAYSAGGMQQQQPPPPHTLHSEVRFPTVPGVSHDEILQTRSPSRYEFEHAFKVQMAKELGCHPDDIVIDGLERGSIVVKFSVVSREQAGSRQATAIYQQLLFPLPSFG